MKRELNADEWEGVMSFTEWFAETKPKVINTEVTVFAPDDKFAGTVDLICEIDDEVWIIDFKTGNYIWDSYKAQLNAYKIAVGIKDARMGILQLGYKKNLKKKWKFTEIDNDPALVKLAYDLWKRKYDKVQPKQREYPLTLKLKQGEKTNETTKTRNKNL